jgi:hypothetical protein
VHYNASHRLPQYTKSHAAAVTVSCSIDENLRAIFFVSSPRDFNVDARVPNVLHRSADVLVSIAIAGRDRMRVP